MTLARYQPLVVLADEAGALLAGEPSWSTEPRAAEQRVQLGRAMTAASLGSKGATRGDARLVGRHGRVAKRRPSRW